MQRDNKGMNLSAVFVDYDNIYLSLKRKNEEAAKRFSKDASLWIRAIENGQLITPTNGQVSEGRRRIVLNRCYGNPVPKRNANDNSTDMTSFPFVRHHFLRAGFEIVDCPPLTAQLKNSSDIRMVMDMRDYLTHETYFDEFIILSGDADFTPVLHRLRQHARRTVIFANDQTATPYTAICDGEVREADLIALLLGADAAQLSSPVTQQLAATPLGIDTLTPHAPMPRDVVGSREAFGMRDGFAPREEPPARTAPPRSADIRQVIIADVVASVRAAPSPIPLETLADRAVRAMGHDRSAGTNWGGAGTFRDLLRQELPTDVRVSEHAPFVAYDMRRHGMSEPINQRQPEMATAYVGAVPTQAVQSPAPPQAAAPMRAPSPTQTAQQQPTYARQQGYDEPVAFQPAPQQVLAQQSSAQLSPSQPSSSQRSGQQAEQLQPAYQPVARTSQAVTSTRSAPSTTMQQTIMRIYEASQAPQIAPAEYRVLFEGMAQELTDNQLNGDMTLQNIVTRARDRGVDVQADDVRFVLEVVGETDPWFEQGASANLFAGRFRNFIVARCREIGMKLSAAELDMIDSWFAPAVGSRSSDRMERGMIAQSVLGNPVGEVSTTSPMQTAAMGHASTMGHTMTADAGSAPLGYAPLRPSPQAHVHQASAPQAPIQQAPIQQATIQQASPQASAPQAPAAPYVTPASRVSPVMQAQAVVEAAPRGSRWWALDAAKAESNKLAPGDVTTTPPASTDDDEFPRIVRGRGRV
jgi:hypothetical protein